MKSNSKKTVRILIEEVFNKGNINVLDEIIHPEYSYRSPSERMEGIGDLKAFILAFRSAFPDIHLAIDEQFSEAERICTRFTMTGTHNGDFLGMPATGRRAELQGVVISRLEDGLIKEEWELLDQLTLLQQLGVS